MKEKINLKKKKKKDKKKNEIEFDDQLKKEQQKLFEMSKIEAMNILSQEGKLNQPNKVLYKINEDDFVGRNDANNEEVNYDEED